MKQEEAKLIVDAKWLREHRDDAGVVVVDTRPAKDFHAGHIRGARHFDPFPFHHTDTSERGIAEFSGQLQWIFSALGISGRETVGILRERIRDARGARTMVARIRGASAGADARRRAQGDGG